MDDFDTGEILLLSTFHTELFSIATRADAEYARRVRDYHQQVQAGEEAIVAGLLLEDAGREAIVAITFAAFAAEAFINAYGAEVLAKDVLRKLARLPTLHKWELFPRLANGDRAIDDADLEPLRRLFKLRNNLAHGKAGWRPLSEWKSAILDWHDRIMVAAHVEAVRRATRALHAIDDRAELAWLEGSLTVRMRETQ